MRWPRQAPAPDAVEDLSHGSITARVNWSLVARIVVAKRRRGDLAHRATSWTSVECTLNERHQRERQRRLSGEVAVAPATH